VKLWVIVQNLGQLKRHYKDGWETFIANAGVVMAFANADLETLDYLRGKLGNVPLLLNRSSGASSSALLSGARPMQDDLREAGLLEPDERRRICRRARRVQRRSRVAANRQTILVDAAGAVLASPICASS